MKYDNNIKISAMLHLIFAFLSFDCKESDGADILCVLTVKFFWTNKPLSFNLILALDARGRQGTNQ